MPVASLPPVVFLMGPTACGKTDLAVELVERLPLDIISVDSAMVYRGMDVGTGKPGRKVLARAPHRLLDIMDPEHPYSAADFTVDAMREIGDIHASGRIPLLVGGTGLYFRALRDGLSTLPPADPQVRARLEAEARSVGWATLHQRLQALDPVAAARIHPNDPQRIQRALEVHEITGHSISALQALRTGECLNNPVVALILEPSDRGALHQRIARRFEAMLAQDLVAEVSALMARPGVHEGLPAMRAVGYRQVWEHLTGGYDLESMTARAIAATRQLARRQLTWLSSETRAVRFEAEDASLLPRVVDHLSRAM